MNLANPAMILAVWQKGKVVPKYDPAVWRQDECGAWIQFAAHGKTTSQYGWEIDYIVPKDRGGLVDLSNFRPVQWENIRSKAAGNLVCKVKAKGLYNGPV